MNVLPAPAPPPPQTQQQRRSSQQREGACCRAAGDCGDVDAGAAAALCYALRGTGGGRPRLGAVIDRWTCWHSASCGVGHNLHACSHSSCRSCATCRCRQKRRARQRQHRATMRRAYRHGSRSGARTRRNATNAGSVPVRKPCFPLGSGSTLPVNPVSGFSATRSCGGLLAYMRSEPAAIETSPPVSFVKTQPANRMLPGPDTCDPVPAELAMAQLSNEASVLVVMMPTDPASRNSQPAARRGTPQDGSTCTS
jgi:hypothetical protein